MSSASRQSKRNQTNQSYSGYPGPQSYEPNLDISHIQQPKWTIGGTHTREMPIIKNLPGPGQYEPKFPESQRKTLIYGKSYQIDKEQQNKPGPGQYVVENSQLSRIGFKIGSEKRYKDEKKISPGPGEYHVQQKGHVPAYKIGTQSRSQKITTCDIGPGQYNIPSLLKTDVGFKIMPRREKTHSMITPGPDQYEQIKRERGISFKIGTSKREGIFQKSISPGPGEYLVEHQKENAGYSIGKSQRANNKFEMIPGPGAYKVYKPSNAPKYSIYQRYRQKTDNIGPGPQSYTIGEFKDTKSIIFPQAKRDSCSKLNFPGPGDYETDQKKKPNVSIVFGREKRSQSCSENYQMPGPGQYEVSFAQVSKKKQ